MERGDSINSENNPAEGTKSRVSNGIKRAWNNHFAKPGQITRVRTRMARRMEMTVYPRSISVALGPRFWRNDVDEAGRTATSEQKKTETKQREGGPLGRRGPQPM